MKCKLRREKEKLVVEPINSRGVDIALDARVSVPPRVRVRQSQSQRFLCLTLTDEYGQRLSVTGSDQGYGMIVGLRQISTHGRVSF